MRHIIVSVVLVWLCVAVAPAAADELYTIGVGEGMVRRVRVTPKQREEARRAEAESQARADKAQLELASAQIKSLETQVLKHMEYTRKLAVSLTELTEAYKALSAQDKAYDPNVRPAGAPAVPVSCASGECEQCYATAQEALNKAVFTLEKLRIIYLRTKKFADKAMSFGDSASSIHAVQGLAWQTAKRDIEASVKRMEVAFDGKKPELMARLKAALEQIAKCEAEHYRNPDWYDRFGFAYYQFLDQKYSR